MHRSLLIALFVAPACVLPAQAQLTEMQPGARVRIEAPGIVAGHFVGTVLSRSADTVVIGAPSATPVRVPIDRLTAVQVSRGSSRSLGALRGLMWGVPIGLVVGVVGAASSESQADIYCVGYSNCGSTSSSYKTGIIAGSTLGGAIWGAGIGALIGRERWERFDVTPRTSFNVRRGSASLGVALAF